MIRRIGGSVAFRYTTLLGHRCIVESKLPWPYGWVQARSKSVGYLENLRELKRETLCDFSDTTKHQRQRVYLWGNAATGALGVRSFVFPEKEWLKPRKKQVKPYRLAVLDKEDLKVKNVACGYGFTLFGISGERNEGLVYGCGINVDSQIGYHIQRAKGDPVEYVIHPVPLRLPVSEKCSVTHVAAGRAHSIIATNKQGVFSLGNNARGQCGRSIIDDEIYTGSQVVHKVSFDKEIKQVVCGADHTLILTTEGDVYSCGLGTDGQTGLGHYDAVGRLTRVEGDIKGEEIVDVACRADCVLVVSKSGEVFGWGNSEYGQLESVVGKEPQVNTPRNLPFRSLVGHTTRVAAGGSTCALINEEGDVYVWGFGLLGKGPKLDRSAMPTKIPATLFGRNEFNTDIVVTQIYAGMNFLAATNNIGELYTWGRNRNAALGLNKIHDQFFPFKVSVPALVNRVYCGVDHMVALCRPFA